jgi:hopene-associated glycosyltransferase HpnB
VIAMVLAAIAVAAWLYLIFARGGFWRCVERDDWPSAKLAAWPSVAVVVPARNEAAQIGVSMQSLARQDYAGPWTVILVDDDSSDGTADIARRSFLDRGDQRLRIVRCRALPAGWTGKLWAIKQGLDLAMALPRPPDYLLLTDADIEHPPDSISRLVTHAHPNGLVLTSLMVKLRCRSFAERASVPAFIFFFQMLYPFSWVNQPHRAVAAAAGGCMFLRADALAKAGGIEVIRGALIDDCALARVLKRHGPIWLALTTRVTSNRRYESLADIRAMVVRSAYAQLRYSPLLLTVTIAAMVATFLAPPVIALFGTGIARLLGVVSWCLMALAFAPTLRLYRCSILWGFALPAIALLYLIFTVDAAYQYARGRGGTWKGRVQANVQSNASELQ